MGDTIKRLFVLNLVLAVTSADFTENCPDECKCVWAGGNKQVDCSNGHFDSVPKNISTDIQTLNLSGNPIHEISKEAFSDIGQVNLKKLFLSHCQLEVIHKQGLKGLAIMIELDLSFNNLTSLHRDTFDPIEKIRWIFLNDNRIEKLDDGLFKNLPFLQRLYLSNNRIVQIGVKTFMNVPKLSDLRLDNNKLEHLKVDVLDKLPLANLDLHENPWRCDCYLAPLRNWFITKNLHRVQIVCVDPPKLHKIDWKNLSTSDFACKPSIVYPTTNTTIRSSDTNITLSCQVDGNPLPEVHWVFDGQIIDGSSRYKGVKKYLISESSTDNSKWVNVTIVDTGVSDNGDYICAAENTGGVDEKMVALAVAHNTPGIVVPTGMDNNMLPVLIGVSCTAAILLIILIIFCWCCCRRRNSEKKGDTSNGEALIEGSVIPEMEKSLITAVNPVTKPPRRYDVPPLITSAGTEMSELNKTLLDNDSVFGKHTIISHFLFRIDNFIICVGLFTNLQFKFDLCLNKIN